MYMKGRVCGNTDVHALCPVSHARVKRMKASSISVERKQETVYSPQRLSA
jgi:predicted HNH restriction endonuclease